MNYVVHFCHRCGKAFIAEDHTKVKDRPPTWRLCPDCCKELGIDYKKQKRENTDTRNRSNENLKLGGDNRAKTRDKE